MRFINSKRIIVQEVIDRVLWDGDYTIEEGFEPALEKALASGLITPAEHFKVKASVDSYKVYLGATPETPLKQALVACFDLPFPAYRLHRIFEDWGRRPFWDRAPTRIKQLCSTYTT